MHITQHFGHGEWLYIIPVVSNIQFLSLLHQIYPSTMSTTSMTISSPIILENPWTYGHSTCNLEFDGQLWLGPNNTITGKFRYYNKEDILFNEINYYIAWIHIFFFSFLSYNSST